MGTVISLLPARLEARVAESWRRLVTLAAADRGMSVGDVDTAGEFLWREWATFLSDADYSAEIVRRQAALRKLMLHDLPGPERDEAIATLTAAMPPEWFRHDVLEPVALDGWQIFAQPQPRQFPPDVPPFLATIVAKTSAIAGGTGQLGGTDR